MDLTVRRTGAGDPVVLVHGSGGGLDSWNGVVKRLAGSYELWTVARRGYRPSPLPSGANKSGAEKSIAEKSGANKSGAKTDGPKTFADDVADLSAVIAAAGRPAHLVGASYGATAALHTALAAPPGLRSIALFEPPLFAAGPAIAPLLDRYRTAFERNDGATMAATLSDVTRVPAEVVAAFGGPRPPEPDAARGWLHDLKALAADDLDVSRWSAITTPALLMSGADTWPPMPETMRALSKAIPAVRHEVWPGQSHFATLTAPDLVAATLSDFWRQLS